MWHPSSKTKLAQCQPATRASPPRVSFRHTCTVSQHQNKAQRHEVQGPGWLHTWPTLLQRVQYLVQYLAIGAAYPGSSTLLCRLWLWR